MDKNKSLIIMGTAHGDDVSGKVSPDKKFYEWKFSRHLCKLIKDELVKQGYNAVIDWEGDNEIGLRNRCKIVNDYCKQYGASNCLYVSVHGNAASNTGEWCNARGFSVYVAPNASANSKKLAALLTDEARNQRLMGNRFVPSCKYWTGNFAVIKNVKCVSVLTENLFYDNKEDLAIMQSDEGKKKIVDLHVAAINKYFNS